MSNVQLLPRTLSFLRLPGRPAQHLVGRFRSFLALRKLVQAEEGNPELQRFFSQTFLGRKKLQDKSKLVGGLLPLSLPSRLKLFGHNREEGPERCLAKARAAVDAVLVGPQHAKWQCSTLHFSWLQIEARATSPAVNMSSTTMSNNYRDCNGVYSPTKHETIAHVRNVLRKNFSNILEDYRQITTWYQDQNITGTSVVKSGKWTKFPVLSYAKFHEEANWTFTQQLLQSEELAPYLAKGLGSCYFSRLQGKTHIREHYGPTNGRVRVHLGLEIPGENGGLGTRGSATAGVGDHRATSVYGQDSTVAAAEVEEAARVDVEHQQQNQHCFLRVGDSCYPWIQGDILAFDDSFYHGVYLDSGDGNATNSSSERENVRGTSARIKTSFGNKSKSPASERTDENLVRGVLVLDIYHPDLTFAERRFLEQMEQINAKFLPKAQNWSQISNARGSFAH
ncbi:unnamed protein product [Amoebophrya sp. A120]|nr:unnamed protein product [Amoebophrya sp. A120]|eukprot:GSA120T00012122001.1